MFHVSLISVFPCYFEITLHHRLSYTVGAKILGGINRLHHAEDR